MDKIIDLRSDTVTLPTPNMRRAISEAPLGDDVFGEDPTVNELQRKASEMLGKEAALFVPSGTMGNEVAIRAHTQPGQEIIVEERSHIYNYEAGGPAALSGVQIRPIRGHRGAMSPKDIEAAIKKTDNPHFANTSLICLENTHNAAGGTVVPISVMQETYEMAVKYGIAVHLDGARIFNASVALGLEAREIARYADSVMFCVSKGLSAPVGSLVVGSKEFIKKAYFFRKMFGGGMRQAGVLAAAGIVALSEMIPRLKEDHENARILAERLKGIKGLSVDMESVQTNIVFLSVDRSINIPSFLAKMGERKIKALQLGPTAIRMVTHKDVSREDMYTTIEAARSIIGR
jgi:threonine aldolase